MDHAVEVRRRRRKHLFKKYIYLESRTTNFFWSLWEKTVTTDFFGQQPVLPVTTRKTGHLRISTILLGGLRKGMWFKLASRLKLDFGGGGV